MSEKDYEWQREANRVQFVRNVIDQKTSKLEEELGGLKQDIVEFRRDFWEDVTVNLDEPDDVIETQASIKQQAEVLSERERSHGQSSKQLKILSRLKNTPYFGRIDFHEDGEQEVGSVYLGISSLMDEHEENFLIYDWRAPISSLYYDYYPGPAKYDTPEGTITGNMELKRQFIIKNGEIKGMFDTGVTIGDELLQKVLSNQSDTQMKSIVATIQKEQNQIIRNETSKFLLVQGVAGSGKTSAALQRVAYLLYRFRKTLNAENVMLFSPNTLFNSYVATVLPELGEENMVQTTFKQYLDTRLGTRFKIESPFTQMEELLTTEGNETKLEGIRYKSSRHFKEQLDQYIESLMKEGLIFKNITFRGEKFISAKQINTYFYSLESTISIPNRMKMVADWLMQELAKKERKERKQDWVLAESELLDREDFLKVYNKLQKNEQDNAETFDDFEREQTLLAKMVVEKYIKPIKKAIKSLKFINITAVYRQFFEKEFAKKEICRQTIEKLKQKQLSYEDATAYLYLQDKLEGRKPNLLIRHLFIDEAQDYSPFQLAFLQQLFPNSKMTILGDMNQAIYAHSMNAPTLLSSELYEGEKLEKITLTRSYRSTRQIVEFTKGFIAGGEAIEPFNRDGKKPTLYEVDNEEILAEKIVHHARALQSEGHQTIAIICKTVKESKVAFEMLKNELSIRLIEKETDQFEKGILILPVYFAKGIEFDAVIMYNGSNIRYGKEYDRNLFYTACTRAMHELRIFSIGEKSRFIAEAADDTYETSTE